MAAAGVRHGDRSAGRGPHCGLGLAVGATQGRGFLMAAFYLAATVALVVVPGGLLVAVVLEAWRRRVARKGA